MKKQLIFWILIFTIKNLIAQNPVPFPMQDVTWSVEEYIYSLDITEPDACITRHYGYGGDTIIDGNIYGKLYGNNLFGDWPYEDVEFNLATAKYVAAVRQDSTRKVWVRRNIDTLDVLYYDFGLIEGDTFCFNYINGNCHSVYSVDSIQLDGIWRKQISFDFTTNGEIWIDGVGSLTGWFEWLYIGNISHRLVCYQTMDNLVYGAGDCHCDTYTSTQNLYWEKDLKIFPNPTTEKLNIQIPSKNNETYIFTLYSIFGEKIKEELSDDKILQMSLKDLENGIYLLSIKDADSNIFTKKIVKTNR